MAQAIVQKPGAKTKAPHASPALPSDIVARLYERAEKFSTLHAMACTCKSWNTSGEPVFTSLRKLAFDYYGGKAEPETIFTAARARNFALSYLVSRIASHAMEELPEHVIMLSCSFSNFLSELDAKDATVNVARYFSMLRGLTKVRWGQLISLLNDPEDEVLLRLAASSSPQAPLMFPHPQVLLEERQQSAADLANLYRNKELGMLVNSSYLWARNYGAKGLPETLFHALPDANFTFYWEECRLSFTAETIISLLKQPLPEYRRACLMKALVGPLWDRIPDTVKELPEGSEPEVLSLINAWLLALPSGDDAEVLRYLAIRIEMKKFDLSKASTQLNELVIRAYARKKLKCEHSALFIKTLRQEGILSNKQLKEAKEAAKQLN